MSRSLRLKLADGSEIEATVEGSLPAQLGDLLEVGYVGNQMRIEADESDDVAGHSFAASVRVRLFDEDDVEGHALTLHLPTAQAAQDLQKKLLAAGIAGLVVVGAATTAVVAPSLSGTADQAGAPAVPLAAPAPAIPPGLKADIAAGDATAPRLAPAPAIPPGLKADIAAGDATAPRLAPAPAIPPGLKADIAAGEATAPVAPELSDESSYPPMPGESRAR